MTRDECNSLSEEMMELLKRSKIKNWYDENVLAWDGNNTISLKYFATHQVMDIEKVKRIFSTIDNTYIKSYNDFLSLAIKKLSIEGAEEEFLIKISIFYPLQLHCSCYTYKNNYVRMQEGIRMFITDVTQCIIH